MLRVGDLSAAHTGVSFVAPDASFELAQSLMLRDDYSQLAVLSGERNLRGAISWESIALARLRDSEAGLKDAIVSADPVDLNQDLLALIPRIVEDGFLFVLAADRTLSGIVTMADLSVEFSNLATPFFLLGEIERRLRRRVDECFDRRVLESVLAPDDTDREVHAAQDLTFGEYGRLLEQPENWTKLAWSVDRKTFVATLNDVREIRNEVMHFSPDPMDDEQVVTLRNFIRWLRILDPRP
jgi:restriction system protein